jgi:hypothetical protein
MSVQSVKMTEDIQDRAEEKAFEYAMILCPSDKDGMIGYVEDNWPDYVEDKHKHLFED